MGVADEDESTEQTINEEVGPLPFALPDGLVGKIEGGARRWAHQS